MGGEGGECRRGFRRAPGRADSSGRGLGRVRSALRGPGRPLRSAPSRLRRVVGGGRVDGLERCWAARRAHTVNPCLTSDLCAGPYTIYRVSDRQPVAVVAGPEYLDGFTNDDFANFYLWGEGSGQAEGEDVVYRVLPEQLPPGFYGYDPPVASPRLGWEEQAARGLAAPHPLAAVCTGPEPPPVCAEWWAKRLVEGVARAWEAGVPRADVQRLESLSVRASQPAQRSVICPVVEAGTLVLDVRRHDGTVMRVEEPAGVIGLSLGEPVALEAKWKRGDGAEQDAQVVWTLRDAAPTWAGAHPAEPGSTDEVLFENDVLLLFDEGNPIAAVAAREAQVVHTGSVELELRLASDQSPDGQEHRLTVSVSSGYAAQLGSTHNEYDGFINRFADAYGILPQVLKGLIDHESGNWNPQQYRYEPAGWDYGSGLGGRGVKDRLGESFLASFRTEEGPLSGVGSYSRGSNTTADEMDAWMRSTPDKYKMMAAVYDPASRTWECIDPLVISGTPVWAMAFYWGSNGAWFGKTDPRTHMSPCNKRLNWDVRVDVEEWVRSHPTSKPTGAAHATWWFYNHYYNAQTFLAASYGLTQIGYVTVVQGLGWHASQPADRAWAEITDPENNIYLGARWLVQRGWPSFRREKRQAERRSHHQSDAIEELSKLLACTYNGQRDHGKPTSNCGYGDDVWLRSRGFLPVNQGGTP